MERIKVFERAVLEKLVAAAPPALQVLHRQVELARVVSRDFAGDGSFLSFELPDSAPVRPFRARAYLGLMACLISIRGR